MCFWHFTWRKFKTNCFAADPDFRIALSSRESPDASSREVTSRGEQSSSRLVVSLDETNDYNLPRKAFLEIGNIL
jgi:hypothetical protein